MRADARQLDSMFSYVSPEQRVPADHPRRIRRVVDEILGAMSPEFDGLYARVGRPSIPPERLGDLGVIRFAPAADTGEQAQAVANGAKALKHCPGAALAAKRLISLMFTTAGSDTPATQPTALDSQFALDFRAHRHEMDPGDILGVISSA